jgi:hypothetical protein
MNQTKYLLLFISYLFSPSLFCQKQVDENFTKIEAALDNYFDLEREAVHLHLNKTTFINNETIWYQGYVVNRKTNMPYFTTNVFVVLYDEAGKQLSEKLVYASNGVFTGNIPLDAKLESGNYYIQVYTNWMNNFSENESTVTKVNVINPPDGIRNYKKVNTESLELYLNPEGKSLISDVSNTIGVCVKDCRGNAPENLEASIQYSSGEILKTIKLNRFGFGKFEIIPTGKKIKVVVKANDRTSEKTLQTAELIGISVEVNTFSIENKTAIKIKANQSGIEAFQSKKLSLVIHQDQKLTVYPFQFKLGEFEQTFLVNNSDLHEGINTVRIIDSDLKQWAERLIYIRSSAKSNFNVLKNNRNQDKINLAGYSESLNSMMSVSILPENTKSLDSDNSIIAGITINPYLIKSLANANYYLTDPNRLKMYELDLALLNEENSKYNWDYIKMNPPKPNYSFDIGLALKGKIDAATKNKAYHKVKLIAYKNRIMQSADVSEDGEYQFEHLLLTDSTIVNLSLEKLPDFQKIPATLIPQLVNRVKKFNKPYSGCNCSNLNDYETITDFDIPKFDDKIIKLDEVIVKKKATGLAHSRILANSMLRGYKIDETNNHGSLLNFIELNGFSVSRNLGDVSITSRQRMSLNSANPTPVVYIDDRPLFFSFNELDIMQMTEIDEIYIDSHAISASINNNVGIIKIYTKKPQTNYFTKPGSNGFLIKEAYSENVPFKNEDYLSTQNKGFDNYGILGWSPIVKSDESGAFLFDVIDYNKGKCKIIIEGMTPEGGLFHEEKIVQLK